jgi:hypothetical protein
MKPKTRKRKVWRVYHGAWFQYVKAETIYEALEVARKYMKKDPTKIEPAGFRVVEAKDE